MKDRAFGWIQDPGKWENLRHVVEIFCTDSKFHQQVKEKIFRLVDVKDRRKSLIVALSRRPLRMTYRELVGTACTPRSEARCNGIVQAAIEGQKRPFIADWPADNFLRWAHALSFVKWEANDDCFKVTKTGIDLSKTVKKSDEEYRIYADALLSYPPAMRIINLLNEATQKNSSMTKFALGEQLGFKGDKGFTHIDEKFFIKEYIFATPEEKKKMRSNWEGDSDKYARMICGWMLKLKYPWVRREHKKFSLSVDGKTYNHTMIAYALTKHGFEERKKSSGISSSRKISKFVPYQMFCTKGVSRDLLRKRRALITRAICKRPLSTVEISQYLALNNIETREFFIRSDLDGLKNIGLLIEESLHGKFSCRDRIVGLDIPHGEPSIDDEIFHLTEKCGEQLKKIPRSFLALIEMSFDRKQSIMFEVKIMELLVQYCGFSGRHLGGSSRPDGAVYCEDYGVIIDAKSYAKGFSIPVSERDKMGRYVYEAFCHPDDNETRWWVVYPPSIAQFLFLFVSSKFVGQFRKQLRALGDRNKQNSPGAAISAGTLLLVSEKIANGTMSLSEFKKYISCLDEVVA